MDLGNLNLFMKMVVDEYKLTKAEQETLLSRMLADDKEFERVWNTFKSKRTRGGVDSFRALLSELIS